MHRYVKIPLVTRPSYLNRLLHFVRAADGRLTLRLTAIRFGRVIRGARHEHRRPRRWRTDDTRDRASSFSARTFICMLIFAGTYTCSHDDWMVSSLRQHALGIPLDLSFLLESVFSCDTNQ
jgi:hypothetical protein